MCVHIVRVLDNLISNCDAPIEWSTHTVSGLGVLISIYLPGQLRVKDEYLKPVLDLDSTLEYFIPTTTGPGACTFALVHYLVYVHNNFIDWCRGKNKARYVRETERQREISTL